MFPNRPTRRNGYVANYAPLNPNMQTMQAYQQGPSMPFMPSYGNVPLSQAGGYGPVSYSQAMPNYPIPPVNYTNKSQPKLAEAVFQNPLQQPEMSFIPQQPYGMGQSYMNPYPKQSTIPRPPSGVKSIMNSFKTQEGNFDVNKMVNTAGQMMNAVSQVSSMVKGLGGIFKV